MSLNIALIGHGKMGKIIEEIAVERGHSIVCIIDADNVDDLGGEVFKKADVAIEFTTPATAFDNCRRAVKAGVPVVSGTTGWLDRLDELKKIVDICNGAFFYSSNYSIGVNLFFALNKYLAKLMNKFSRYNVDIKEIHHIHKLDHPSGTAITIADGILSILDRKTGWRENTTDNSLINLRAERVGEVPGTHIVTYKSAEDAIRIEHEAFSRRGFALGAVVAAEWLKGRHGWFGMDDMLHFND